MRHLGLSMIGLAAIAAAMMAPLLAHADPYKWCAVYGSRDVQATNCGFVTYQQCLATISGIGGYCTPNQFYTGPQGSKRARKRH